MDDGSCLAICLYRPKAGHGPYEIIALEQPFAA
jgi:hypothetical protein